jgi:hypothetical protein
MASPRQDAVERLGASVYVFSVGVLVLLGGVLLGFVIGMVDIFIGQLLLGRPDVVQDKLGDRFVGLARDTFQWYLRLVQYVAFGLYEFDWLP